MRAGHGPLRADRRGRIGWHEPFRADRRAGTGLRWPVPVAGLLLVLALLLAGCTSAEEANPTELEPRVPTEDAADPEAPAPEPVNLPGDTPALTDVIPAPVTAEPGEDRNFELAEDAAIIVAGDEQVAGPPAEYLAELLGGPTGFDLPIQQAADDEQMDPSSRAIVLRTGGEDLAPGGYRLDVHPGHIELTAGSRDGFFSGVATIRQLLPDDIEAGQPVERTWAIAGGTIDDEPRFEYRSAMLDVARHFFDVDVVKRHIDRLAQYKINHLHLHLTDDQGWRIEIESWPRLTEVGGANEVGGGPGGFYTQEDYAAIVDYAARRGITVVPEIDMPGHTNAALVAYPELSCDGTTPEPYTGTQVGFSSLCVDSETTYEFASDVIGEVAELTPGEYLHIGGDEAEATTEAEYAQFFDRVLPMITEAGKRPIGWHEYAEVELPEPALVQYWRLETSEPATRAAAGGGTPVIMSPASQVYLDMKYTPDNPWGNDWAGPVDVRTAYTWDPAGFLDGVGEQHVHGVEAPLWTELVETESEIERMTFPRIQAVAEVAWSPQESRDWEDFRTRLAGHGERMDRQGIDFHRSPEIAW